MSPGIASLPKLPFRAHFIHAHERAEGLRNPPLSSQHAMLEQQQQSRDVLAGTGGICLLKVKREKEKNKKWKKKKSRSKASFCPVVSLRCLFRPLATMVASPPKQPRVGWLWPHCWALSSSFLLIFYPESLHVSEGLILHKADPS